MNTVTELEGCWVAYIVECADKSLYTGITNDLGKRIQAHNQGAGARYTSGRRPVKLLYHELCADRSAATIRERAIKKLSKLQKLKLIKNARQQQL